MGGRSKGPAVVAVEEPCTKAEIPAGGARQRGSVFSASGTAGLA
jgi:hypothetical protein